MDKNGTQILEEPLTKNQINHRMGQIIKALSLGYELTTYNGLTICADSDWNMYWVGVDVKTNEKQYQTLFDGINLKYLSLISSKMTEAQFFDLTTFITLNKDKELKDGNKHN